jgi:CheY-like chemotaxis protein
MSALARLLVVDDDVNVAEVLQDYFGDEGYEVRIADNGRVGLDLLTSGARTWCSSTSGCRRSAAPTSSAGSAPCSPPRP